jgi:hypothetical protein
MYSETVHLAPLSQLSCPVIWALLEETSGFLLAVLPHILFHTNEQMQVISPLLYRRQRTTDLRTASPVHCSWEVLPSPYRCLPYCLTQLPATHPTAPTTALQHWAW